MPPIPDEYQLQRAFYQWLIGWPNHNGIPTKPPALLPGVECWHTPNGGTRSNAFEGKRLKDIGVRAGIPDLLFLAKGKLYGMEWKKPGGVLSPAQREMHPRLLSAGMVAVITVESLQAARAWSFLHGLALPIS
jgi:hypothetical protein